MENSGKFVLGVCGGSGSGKTTVTHALSLLGGTVIDCDAIYSELVDSGKKSDCLADIAAIFGKRAVYRGRLNRKYVGRIVFSDPEKLKALNLVAHKAILAEAEKRMDEAYRAGKRFFIIDAPLLFESGFDKKCDFTLAVIADEEKRIARIIARDGISEEDARKRVAAQNRDDYLIGRADMVITNNGTEAELAGKAREIYHSVAAPRLEN